MKVGLSQGRLGGVCTLVLAACGGGGDTPVPEDAPASVAAAPLGDPLLDRARGSLRQGRLDPDDEARILASDDPAHARARRLLQAMRDEPVSSPGVSPAAVAPGEVRSGVRAETKAGETPSSAVSSPSPRAPKRLGAVRLGSVPSGVALHLEGSRDLVVGLASQPGAGLVRLILDGVTAEPAALRAPPTREGVRVTEIRRSATSVHVTLSLDPGWRLGAMRRSARGAVLELLRP
jgi:hypothetical protein